MLLTECAGLSVGGVAASSTVCKWISGNKVNSNYMIMCKRQYFSHIYLSFYLGLLPAEETDPQEEEVCRMWAFLFL